MSAYELAELSGTLSLVLGVALCMCAFMLPQGLRSPLGLLMLALGLAVIGSGFIQAPTGQTYAKYAFCWVLGTS